MIQLTSRRVDELMRACLFQDDETFDGAITVEGIINNYGFHPGRIAEHAGEIGELLAELPDEFQADKGGGWSFLSACDDRHGNQWTGLHLVMERLFCLGIAAGKAEWLLPRKLWQALPGGMPYVKVMS